MDFVFLGTAIGCITQPESGCLCCLDSLRTGTDGPGGVRNRRRNTSAAIRVQHEGESRTIIIDAGKSFYAAACEWFPRHGLRRIDALLLTHAHLDACMLDDLRAWTLHSNVQDHLDIYLDALTLASITATFPFLVSAAAATGGGDLPELTFHTIEAGVEFELFGVKIMPMNVEHGRYFTAGEAIRPFHCLAFMLNADLLYMSDVSHVPQEAFDLIDSRLGSSSLPVLVVDALRIGRHSSHFGFGQAVQLARRLRPQRTYCVGFAHGNTHEDLTAVGRAVETGRRADHPRPSASAEEVTKRTWACAARTGKWDTQKRDPEAFAQMALQEIEDWSGNEDERNQRVWLRPAHDGLALRIENGQVSSDADHEHVTTNGHV